MGSVNKWLAEQGEMPNWDWTKLSQQKDYIASPVQFTMFSGGFGTGKTSALCGKIVGLMTLVPNNLGYLARQDGKALKQTTMLSLLEMIPKEWIFRHDSQKGVLKFTPEAGGSMLIYGDLKDTGDLKNHNLGSLPLIKRRRWSGTHGSFSQDDSDDEYRYSIQRRR